MLSELAVAVILHALITVFILLLPVVGFLDPDLRSATTKRPQDSDDEADDDHEAASGICRAPEGRKVSPQCERGLAAISSLVGAARVSANGPVLPLGSPLRLYARIVVYGAAGCGQGVTYHTDSDAPCLTLELSGGTDEQMFNGTEETLFTWFGPDSVERIGHDTDLRTELVGFLSDALARYGAITWCLDAHERRWMRFLLAERANRYGLRA